MKERRESLKYRAKLESDVELHEAEEGELLSMA